MAVMIRILPHSHWALPVTVLKLTAFLTVNCNCEQEKLQSCNMRSVVAALSLSWQVQHVERLIGSMKAAADAGGLVGDAALDSTNNSGGAGNKAARARREFAAMKAAMEDDSSKLKTELAAARKALVVQLHARGP